MCGIVGIYEFARRGGAVDEPTIIRMRETVRHRGPDGAGVFVAQDRRLGLGHRRLAIVGVDDGAQPMAGAGGTVLVFNGEIYNYPRLRDELRSDGVRFTTNCDTEVILHLYHRHGRACVEHLDGMFAFALWDPARGELFFARDRVGEKPFYWTEVDGRFLFASEIKALLAHPAVRAEVNEDAIAAYLTNLVTSSPETLYRGIRKLPPGTAGVCSRRGIEQYSYWSVVGRRRPSEHSFEEAATAVRERLDESVHSRLMSDVPLGVLLSGGLDSSTIVALLREKARGLATFSVGFSQRPAIDERAEAARVAAEFGTDHHEVTIDDRDALASLTDLVHHQDEPLADPVCVPLHHVCRLAAGRGIKVVMAGEGADELFWGYPRYSQIMARRKLLRTALRLPRAARALAAAAVPASRQPAVRELAEGIARGRPLPMHMPLGLTRHQRRRLLGRSQEPSPGWTPTDGNATEGRDPIETLGWDTQEYEFGLRLPELLLMRIDRFSMANSIEARVPFLAPDLVELGYSLPFSFKLRGDESKAVLRRAIADVVPEWVLSRKKQGFGAPVVDWFETGLRDTFRDLLETDTVRAYFDTDVLRETIDSQPAFHLWFPFNFALWHRYWIEGKPIEQLTGVEAG
jgi:asparagine synthase (glutamine-hydrolysing)